MRPSEFSAVQEKTKKIKDGIGLMLLIKINIISVQLSVIRCERDSKSVISKTS